MSVSPRPSRDDGRVEEMARLLCRVDSGPHEDALVYIGVPWQTKYGYVVSGDPHPAWTFYRAMAAAALDADWVRDRKRERGE